MKIITDCPLVLYTLYSYDFSACAYNLLKNIGWDVSKIPYEDKKLRNIQIGFLQKTNPNLAQYLYRESINLIDHYININSLSSNDIIIRTRDGFISQKKIINIVDTMPIDLVEILSVLIIDPFRKKYLKLSISGEVEVKGLIIKYADMGFYNLFRNINYNSKKGILIGLENLRRSFLQSDNVLWFCKITEDKETYDLPIKDQGIIKVKQNIIHLIDSEEIDKYVAWDEMIWPFANSLLIHCI